MKQSRRKRSHIAQLSKKDRTTRFRKSERKRKKENISCTNVGGLGFQRERKGEKK
jgi:hypothetical protein